MMDHLPADLSKRLQDALIECPRISTRGPLKLNHGTPALEEAEMFLHQRLALAVAEYEGIIAAIDGQFHHTIGYLLRDLAVARLRRIVEHLLG